MKGAPVPKDIDGYIADCPRDIQPKFRKLRATIRQAAARPRGRLHLISIRPSENQSRV